MRQQKTEISAKVVADSINSINSHRLTTFQIRVPKWLLQEINTHRVLSKSFNSSRAIPAKTIRKSATYTPLYYTKNKSGMSGDSQLSGVNLTAANLLWESGKISAKFHHFLLEKTGLHKQYTNRILEPYLYVDGVISSTEWDNLLKLRIAPEAQPDFNHLAKMIKNGLNNSNPRHLRLFQWHLPYITQEEVELSRYDLKLISAARCARVSYGFQEKFDIEKDFERAEKLLSGNNLHLSPFEHVSMPALVGDNTANFKGWRQLRDTLE
jgi:thymidylate synthase ThyX